MAWKRGIQNNTPGEIRKGHVKEFLFLSSKRSSVSDHLRIIDDVDCSSSRHSSVAFVSNRVPDSFIPFLVDGVLFIHSHDHPRCVLRVLQHNAVPHGCIALSETQRINSKVCVGELQEWTIYQGRVFDSVPSTVILRVEKTVETFRNAIILFKHFNSYYFIFSVL